MVARRVSEGSSASLRDKSPQGMAPRLRVGLRIDVRGEPHMTDLFYSRRQMLLRAGGLGAVGLAGALHSAGLLHAGETTAAPGAAKTPHFTPKAKRVIYLFMNGGPSHVDTFDPKPA